MADLGFLFEEAGLKQPVGFYGQTHVMWVMRADLKFSYGSWKRIQDFYTSFWRRTQVERV